MTLKEYAQRLHNFQRRKRSRIRMFVKTAHYVMELSALNVQFSEFQRKSFRRNSNEPNV